MRNPAPLTLVGIVGTISYRAVFLPQNTSSVFVYDAVFLPQNPLFFFCCSFQKQVDLS